MGRAEPSLRGDVDWTGLEDLHEHLVAPILHLFSVPFYYIEYGIAQLGSLQLWLNYKRDPRAAITMYKSALAQGRIQNGAGVVQGVRAGVRHGHGDDAPACGARSRRSWRACPNDPEGARATAPCLLIAAGMLRILRHCARDVRGVRP